jgi:hypothetical protein
LPSMLSFAVLGSHNSPPFTSFILLGCVIFARPPLYASMNYLFMKFT